MALLTKEAYEGKKRWSDKRMAKNAEIETLTEEQHNALYLLCKYRHEMHCNTKSIWNGGDQADMFTDKCGNICDILSEVGLPRLRKLDFVNIPTIDDYFYLLDDNERNEWEEKAEKFNLENPNGFMHYDGRDLWIEESGEYEKFNDAINKYNIEIEEYLSKIDKDYGTDYCPTGYARTAGLTSQI